MNGSDKAELKSLDVADDKKRQLAQLFPEVVTETRTDDGRLVQAVDFEKLKAVLGTFSEVLENQKERYGMTWPGKNDCLKVIQQPSIATLKPCRAESVNFDQTENLFIEGDNLEVLKLLQKAYYGKVKMIYIDPPYNTGKEFIYPDKYSENLATYLAYTGQVDAEGRKFSTNTEAEGRFHSKWMNMMLPRLYLAKNLLCEDGAIFISIDDQEVSRLRAVCDEIFGEENFVVPIIWQKRITPENRRMFSFEHDYILCYSKSAEIFGETRRLLPLTEEAKSRYKNPDNDPRGAWQSVPAIAQSGHGTKSQFYKLETPDGRLLDPPAGCCWRYNRQRMLKEISENRIWFGSDGKGVPRIKRFLTETRQGITPSTLWFSKNAGANEQAKKELQILMSGEVVFDSPKPTKLIQRMLDISSDVEDGDIILDFFSGSCTTAHAVLDLNMQDGGNRKFIMVQLPEPCDENSEAYKAGYKTIAEIGKERIRRVIKKLNDEDSGKLDLSDGKKPDRGFRVYKLDRSNFKIWDSEQAAQSPGGLTRQLEMHELHIDPKAAQEDILYELLLKAGFPLTIKVEKVKMAGKDVFSISDGKLLICLERDISKELIKAMADASPAQVICLDEGFKANDQLKANAVQTFKARRKGKESEIVFRTV